MTTDKDRANMADTTTALRQVIIISIVRVISRRDKRTTALHRLLHLIIKVTIDHNLAVATHPAAINSGKPNAEASKVNEVINRTVADISDTTLISNSNVSSATNLIKAPVLQTHATAAVTVAIKTFSDEMNLQIITHKTKC